MAQHTSEVRQLLSREAEARGLAVWELHDARKADSVGKVLPVKTAAEGGGAPADATDSMLKAAQRNQAFGRVLITSVFIFYAFQKVRHHPPPHAPPVNKVEVWRSKIAIYYAVQRPGVRASGCDVPRALLIVGTVNTYMR